MTDKMRENFETWWGSYPQEYKLDMNAQEKLDMWVWGAWQAGANVNAEKWYDLGFKASGEGYNGEYGADFTSEYYLTKRKEAIDQAIKDKK